MQIKNAIHLSNFHTFCDTRKKPDVRYPVTIIYLKKLLLLVDNYKLIYMYQLLDDI